MSDLERLRSSLPDEERDLRLNISSVLASKETSLSDDQRLGVALSVAYALKCQSLITALLGEGARPDVVGDARAAASLMAMNNVYYRFRATVGKESYASMPARLRMARLAAPATNKLDFELFCLAVSAVNGCATCVAAHEAAVTKGGLSEERVHDAVRVAAVAAAACHAFL